VKIKKESNEETFRELLFPKRKKVTKYGLNNDNNLR